MIASVDGLAAGAIVELPEVMAAWAARVEARFDIGDTTVVRRRTNEILDEGRPSAVVARQLTRWIYADVHLHGTEDTNMPRNSLDHPWLQELQGLVPSRYPSTGWSAQVRSEEQMILERAGIRVRLSCGDMETVQGRPGSWQLLLPRVRPLHTYGWHFVVGAAGPPSGAPVRLYVPRLTHGSGLRPLADALDAQRPLWQLKFLADPDSQRPDRVVVYTDAAGAADVRRTLSKHLGTGSVETDPGPGFSICTAAGVHETVPYPEQGNASFGLVVSLLVAQTVLRFRRVPPEELMAHFKVSR